MTDAVYTLLRACVIGEAQSDYVFTRENANRVKDFREDLGQGMQGCWSRRSCSMIYGSARNLRRAGIGEGVIQRIGGWKTRSVFERYAIVTRTEVADAMRKLEARA